MHNSSQHSQWGPAISKISLLLLTLVLLITVVYLVRNVLHAIVLGIFFAVILYPLNKYVRRKLRKICISLLLKRKKIQLPTVSMVRKVDNKTSWIASLFLVFMVFCVIVIPLSFFALSVARQGSTTIPSAERWVREEMPQKIQNLQKKYGSNKYVKKIVMLAEEMNELKMLNGAVDEKLQEASGKMPATQVDKGSSNYEFANELSSKLVSCIRFILQKLGHISLQLLSKTWLAVFNFFIMLFVMFHIFQDGGTIWRYMKSISPLDDEAQKKVAIRTKEVSRAIFFSIFGTACIQGLCAMFFFRIVGIPALFWGFVLGICSIIPIVGTGLIWVPATAYLYLTGHPGQAVFILVACGCFTSNIDSIIRPLLIKQGGKTGMSYLVLFFSVLGGLQTFGLVGVIYGPLITGVCSICLLMFSAQFKNNKAHL